MLSARRERLLLLAGAEPTAHTSAATETDEHQQRRRRRRTAAFARGCRSRPGPGPLRRRGGATAAGARSGEAVASAAATSCLLSLNVAALSKRPSPRLHDRARRSNSQRFRRRAAAPAQTGKRAAGCRSRAAPTTSAVRGLAAAFPGSGSARDDDPRVWGASSGGLGSGPVDRRGCRCRTSVYLQGIDIEEIIGTIHARRAPMMHVSAGLEL